MSFQPRLILASASPRRRHFLTELGLRFETCPANLPEAPRPRETPAQYARRVAEEKAAAVAAMQTGLNDPRRALIIAADTIVARGRRLLPKPANPADAERMLRFLSGRSHVVVTGVCVLEQNKGHIVRRKSFSVSTRVWFKRLAGEEIRGYVQTGEPMDKAGAYAIQGIGSFLVQRIQGSYTNVVGLPVAELLDCLEKHFGVKIFPRRIRHISRVK
jgi:septum formation protein